MYIICACNVITMRIQRCCWQVVWYRRHVGAGEHVVCISLCAQHQCYMSFCDTPTTSATMSHEATANVSHEATANMLHASTSTTVSCDLPCEALLAILYNSGVSVGRVVVHALSVCVLHTTTANVSHEATANMLHASATTVSFDLPLARLYSRYYTTLEFLCV